MTTQYADLSTVSGQTLTANLFAVDGDTILYTADTVTERTNAKGVYRCTFGEVSAISGTYRMILFSGSTPFAEGVRVFSGTDTEVASARTENLSARLPATLVSGRIDAWVGAMAANTLNASALATDAVSEIQSGLSTLSAADIRTAVGLASANLDTQLADLPTVAEFEARTIVAANYATASALTTVDTWVKRNAVILSGTIATAGTSSEVFTISALGITATIAVDASGNRSSVTWS